MGTCQVKTNYRDGNMSVDTQPLPRQRIERNQPYPYFEFKKELIFRREQIHTPSKLKIEIQKPIPEPRQNYMLYSTQEEQQSLPKQQRSDFVVRSRNQSLQFNLSISPTSSSRCSDSEKKSNLKQSYLGIKSPKTPLTMSQFAQKKKVRFAKSTVTKSSTQRSISQKDRKRHHRKY